MKPKKCANICKMWECVKNFLNNFNIQETFVWFEQAVSDKFSSVYRHRKKKNDSIYNLHCTKLSYGSEYIGSKMPHDGFHSLHGYLKLDQHNKV